LFAISHMEFLLFLRLLLGLSCKALEYPGRQNAVSLLGRIALQSLRISCKALEYPGRQNAVSLLGLIHWSIAYKTSCFILNIDGDSKGNPGPSGASGVLRLSNDSFVFAFSHPLGVCTNMEADAKALLQGLKLCISRKIERVRIKTDSLSVCKQFNREQVIPWHLKQVLLHIRFLLREYN
jgi:hypothetical protein